MLDEDEDLDEGDGWALPPYPMTGKDSKLRLMAEKCSTCIFRPGNRMDLDEGRVRDMLESVRREDSYVPCHKTLGTGLPTAICRGSNDAHRGQLMRVAERMGAVVEVTEAQVLAEIEERDA